MDFCRLENDQQIWHKQKLEATAAIPKISQE